MYKCPNCGKLGGCPVDRKTWMFRFVCPHCDFEGPEIKPDPQGTVKEAMDIAYNAAALVYPF